MIKFTNGYSDFCIPYNEKEDCLKEILNELIDVGFRNVAIEQTHIHQTIGSKSDPIPEPVKLDSLRAETNGKLNLYNRLTVVYSDPSVTHVLSRSQNFKKYQIVAALPTSESALQHACQTFQGDIVTYNTDTIKIRLNRKFYYLAIRRNMFFELKYSPVIVDASERRATISRAQQYHMVGKSKGILISSEAADRFNIRSPYDISSLGIIFGLSEEQAKCSISTTARKVFVAAECRRLGRTPVLMEYADVNTSTSEEENESDDESSSQESRKRKNDSIGEIERKKIKS
ncbi:CLUMA_CG010053, isoform A [Clunio marinus]|uniref:CLUMA_CG010053, isoform A n=1 Tax=Clunio marinus TaxID=568069 RepID=A0A1J1I8D1_9DIPT|nr:CLUMA_CG010053, isoform A [Clunio marinus]